MNMPEHPNEPAGLAFRPKYPRRFTFVFALLALAVFIAEHINGRFWLNDFRVYYGAGQALLNGEPLYGVAHGLDSGVYKYAPLLALVYALLALLPYILAASIQYLLIALTFLDGMRRIDRLLREHVLPERLLSDWPLLLTGVACVVHLHRELHLGNINMMLLWLLVVALEHLLYHRTTTGAILLGLAVLAKPHFAVLLPLFVLRGKYTVLVISLVTLSLALLAPAMVLGWTTNLALHAQWLVAMADHNAALVYLSGDDYRAVNTIYSFLYRSGGHTFGIAPILFPFIVLSVIAILFALFVRHNIHVERTYAVRNAFAFEYLLLIALVPSITLTDTEHFLLAVPVALYIVHHLVPRCTPLWAGLLAIPLLLAYGGNWSDLMGSLSSILVHFGVLGMGSFGLLVLAIVLHIRSNHSKPPTSERA